MKSTVKRLAALLLAVLLVMSLTACMKQGYNEEDFEPDLSNLPEIEGVDFAAEIEDYARDSFNFQYLSEGETHEAQGAVFAANGGAAYTSDPSVVKVNRRGVVTAVGTGTAYVIVCYGYNNQQTKLTKYMVNHPDYGSDFNANPDAYIKYQQRRAFIIVGIVFAAIVGGVVTLIVVSHSRKPKNDPLSPMFGGASYPTSNNPASPNTYNNAPKQTSAKCPYCGATVTTSTFYCPDCGQKVAK